MSELRPSRILLIDDGADPEALPGLLQLLEVAPTLALSREEALIKIGQLSFAAILLTPGMAAAHGLELGRRIRAHPESQWTPLIFFTSSAFAFDSEQAWSLEAVDVIDLPAPKAALQSKLRFLSELFRRRQTPAADPASSADAEDERLRAQQESEQQLRTYETILSNTPDLAYVFDLNYRFTYANKVLLQMWGRSWEDAIGKNCLELGYEPWHAEMHGREIDQVRATGKPIRGEVPFNGEFGRRIYDYIFVPVFGPDGEVEAVAGTTRDVTERKEAEESLRLSDRRKDEFLAMLAHELRNPLAPISTAAHLLKVQAGDNLRIRHVSDIISRQVKHMTVLVDDLLDVSRVTRGLVDLEQDDLDLKLVAANATEQARPLFEARKHVLHMRMDAGVMQVRGDRTRLIQVIVNLLNNAAKYTPPGGEIGLDLSTAGDVVSISVTDNGIGMDAELLPHVFELFTQAERTPDRSQGGLGIGLALVRSIVALHGGEAQAYSEGPGRGSRFSFTLPRLEQKAEAPDAREFPAMEAAADPVQPLRIMIVDDNLDAAQTLASLLETQGHRVHVAANGADALNDAAKRMPQVFILDIGLPDMDGYELSRRLRLRPEIAHAIYIALTGYGQTHDRLLSKVAGFHHHFVKPMDMQQLQSILAKLG
jgi:PAS domain S-box-containing protein